MMKSSHKLKLINPMISHYQSYQQGNDTFLVLLLTCGFVMFAISKTIVVKQYMAYFVTAV